MNNNTNSVLYFTETEKAKTEQEQWDKYVLKCKRQIRRRNDRKELRRKVRGIHEAIVKRFHELQDAGYKEFETGGGSVYEQKRNGKTYLYRPVNRKDKGVRRIEYIAKNHSAYNDKLYAEARRQMYEERGLNDMYEGLARFEIKILDFINSKWLIIRSRKQHQRPYKENFGYTLKTCICTGDKLVEGYAEKLQLKYRKVSGVGYFMMRDLPDQELKRILDSARKTLEKHSRRCEYCNLVAKPSVKVTQIVERRKKVVPYIL